MINYFCLKSNSPTTHVTEGICTIKKKIIILKIKHCSYISSKLELNMTTLIIGVVPNEYQ